MPHYRVKLTTTRYDDCLVRAGDEEEAIELAKLNYDQHEQDPRIIWCECEEETWPDYEATEDPLWQED